MPAPNGQSPMPGQVDDGDLACAEHVREQEDGDERDHHEVEGAEAAAAERFGLDPYRLVFMIARHARAVERVDAHGGKT